MHLLVGIDTEGDNQWDAAARAQPDVREHLRAAAAARAVRAARRPADLRHHLPGRDRPAIGRRAAAAARRRRLRDRRAPSRVGDAAVHARGRRRGIPTRRRCRGDQFEAQLAALTDAIDRRRRRARRCRTDPAASASRPSTSSALERAGLPRRIERRAALLRSAQGRTGVRRRAAHAVLPRLRQRDAAGHEQPARSAGLGGAEPPAAEAAAVPLRARAAALHDQARAARCSGCCGCAGCGRRTRRSRT